MSVIRLFLVNAWLMAAVVFCVITLPGLAAADVTFNIVFTGTPTGTVTYANVGDLEPTAVSIGDGGISWTLADANGGIYTTQWAAGVPTSWGSPHVFLRNANLDMCNFEILFEIAEYYCAGAGGSYSFSPLASPVVPLAERTGLIVLAGLMGAAAYRRLCA